MDCSLNARMSLTACTHILMWDVGVLYTSDHVHVCMTALCPSGINTVQHSKAQTIFYGYVSAVIYRPDLDVSPYFYDKIILDKTIYIHINCFCFSR